MVKVLTFFQSQQLTECYVPTSVPRYWSYELDRKRRGQSARLWMVIAKCIWWRTLLQSFLTLIELGGLISQSIVLGYLTDYFSIDNPTDIESRNAYLYAAGEAYSSFSLTM